MSVFLFSYSVTIIKKGVNFEIKWRQKCLILTFSACKPKFELRIYRRGVA